MGGEPAGRSSNDRQWTATSNCSSSFSKLEATKKQKGQTKSDQTSIRIAMSYILFLVVVSVLPQYTSWRLLSKEISIRLSGLLKSHFQLSILACKHGRLRRPRRFFAVSAPFAFPKGRQKAQKLQKRIVQRQSLCTDATFEKP